VCAPEAEEIRLCGLMLSWLIVLMLLVLLILS